MKKFLLFTVVFALYINSSRAQQPSSQLDNYPLSILLKVKDVASVVNLTSQKEILLAEYFQNESNSLSAAMQSDPTGKQAAELKKTLILKFQSILTATELQQYSASKRGSEYALPVDNYSRNSPRN